jgi:hypothetical protein
MIEKRKIARDMKRGQTDAGAVAYRRGVWGGSTSPQILKY